MKPQRNRSRSASSLGRAVLLSVVVLFASAAFLVPSFARAQAAAGESIRSFDVSIRVATDRSIDVEETIVYDFGENVRHGIFRTIPDTYRSGPLGRDTIPLGGFSVSDERGAPMPFSVEHGGGGVKLKIGDPDRTITGVHTYVIRYRASDALGAFPGIDEIYWNATGNEWNVPIGSSTASVTLPADADRALLRTACYVGTEGSDAPCLIGEILDPARTVSFASPRELAPYEGLTVAVGFPKGLVAELSVSASVRRGVSSYLPLAPLAIPLIVFVGLLARWRREGRDPKGRGTIVAEYEPPARLTPLQVAMLMRQHVTSRDLPAGIIDLAVKGYVRIEQTEKKVLGIIPTKEYVFIERKPKDDGLGEPEKELVRSIFSSGEIHDAASGLRKTEMSDLAKEKFSSKVHAVSKAVAAALVSAGLYREDPSRTIGRYLLAGSIVLIPGTFVAVALAGSIGPWIIAASILTGLILIGFAFIMPSVTEEGARMREGVLGFKEYLRIAEKDRIAFHNAPERTPELFERFLPYAMVLGVEESWVKEFADIYVKPPEWYAGPHPAAFSAGAFAHDLSGFSRSFVQSASPKGSSGSGGGGFSGGGGGGGGGGSW